MGLGCMDLQGMQGFNKKLACVGLIAKMNAPFYTSKEK
jgi:hypothetical protein